MELLWMLAGILTGIVIWNFWFDQIVRAWTSFWYGVLVPPVHFLVRWIEQLIGR